MLANLYALFGIADELAVAPHNLALLNRLDGEFVAAGDELGCS